MYSDGKSLLVRTVSLICSGSSPELCTCGHCEHSIHESLPQAEQNNIAYKTNVLGLWA